MVGSPRAKKGRVATRTMVGLVGIACLIASVVPLTALTSAAAHAQNGNCEVPVVAANPVLYLESDASFDAATGVVSG